MTTPYIGQITLFPFNFAPKGWALCNGQVLQITQNQALFALIGSTYGGNGQTNFALPNLQGAAALGMGAGYNRGNTGGEAMHTLSIAETPTHTHTLNADASTFASSNGTVPAEALLGQSTGTTSNGQSFNFSVYNTGGPTASLAGAAVATVGGAPHENHMPSLVLNYCIALAGVYPPQN